MNKLCLFGSFGFLEGMARVLDWGSTMVTYNESPTGEEADRRALLSDWQSVGDDIKAAIKLYAKEKSK
jgi:hypothetical protein